mmetsp:Transcript_8803/g.36013  ORF Transcript_8803/g.36013 Transcript_8803/m.36013 type:complete len:234 (+) Transcript_8803:310-1011(+)
MVLEHVCDSGSDSGPRWRASARRNSHPANPVGPSVEAPVQNCSSARRLFASSRRTHSQNQPTMTGSPPGPPFAPPPPSPAAPPRTEALADHAPKSASRVASRQAPGHSSSTPHTSLRKSSGEKARSAERGTTSSRPSRIDRTAPSVDAPRAVVARCRASAATYLALFASVTSTSAPPGMSSTVLRHFLRHGSRRFSSSPASSSDASRVNVSMFTAHALRSEAIGWRRRSRSER